MLISLQMIVCSGMSAFNIDDELLREKLMHKGGEVTLLRCIEICRNAELTNAGASHVNCFLYSCD